MSTRKLEEGGTPSQSTRVLLAKSEVWTRKQVIIGSFSTLLILVFVVIGVIYNQVVWTTIEPEYELAYAVTADAIMVHLEELERIASEHEGSRSVKLGYNASAEYIIDQLQQHCSCEITTDEFIAAIFTENAPPTLEMVTPNPMVFQYNVDFLGLRFSGNDYFDFNATVVIVDNFGCNDTDFHSVNDAIAFIWTNQSNDCSYFTKAYKAQTFGAKAVIISSYLNGPKPRSANLYASSNRGWIEGDPLVTIPGFSVSYTLGTVIASTPNPTLHLTFNTTIDLAPTYNVFCTTHEGSPENQVVVGAHLDSVPAGPGIDDNGSGSCTLLEIAIQWYQLGLVPENQIKFAWWSAEEIGLVGSSSYVDRQVKAGTIGNVAACLNYDMIASPNRVNQIANGTTSAHSPVGSETISNAWAAYFDYMGISYQYYPTSFGRSDFVPFELQGIPIGSLFTGADGLKTEEEFHTYGGLVNAIYDPCYHQKCDNTYNVNYTALSEMAGAGAYMVQHLAQHPNLRSYLNQEEKLAQKSLL